MHPARFRIANLMAPEAPTDPDLRVTPDNTADYAMVSAQFDLLGPAYYATSFLSLGDAHPWFRRVYSA